MKKTILCLLVFLVVFTSTNSAQEQLRPSNEFDADLYNGTIYNFGSSGIDGHQFLESEKFDTGSLTVGEHTFAGLLLNYDIFHQEILFKSGVGFQDKIISLPVETIHSFSIGPRRFIVLQDENWDARIYETIGDEEPMFIRSWSKEIKPSNDISSYNYEFTKPSRITYLSDGEYLHKVKWRKDVLKVFPETNSSDIKKYMRGNKIRIRKASYKQLLMLINYCDTL